MNRPAIADVIRATAAHFGLGEGDLVGPCVRMEYAKPRLIAYALARQMCGRSYSVIGRKFHRDHTTVLYGVRRALADPEAREPMRAIADAIGASLAASEGVGAVFAAPSSQRAPTGQFTALGDWVAG